MTRKRADSFKIALDTLREELRAGVHRAGSRLTANDIAERLSLSQTPCAKRSPGWPEKVCCWIVAGRASSFKALPNRISSRSSASSWNCC